LRGLIPNAHRRCDETQFRAYPDAREIETGDSEFPLAWGPCNIAIQDC